ncbi:ABC transporter ATP-binding protein [Zoogloea oryzae]|uniref:ABC transporter ATP-binding protein n=1 Tax=Zoogloea oryzae TaxID=310767 RepID=A0ABQ6F925_9RHOO|nr:ABC transporter ATP-binding protein [Zoogloea oryzae]GLT22087.1 ABC transporter ATP-binding protein [Zoogloea oryzae]
MLIECRSITAGYNGSPVLENIDISIGEGEIVTLVGANGAGKSTLVNTISGLLRPMAGEIHFDGKRIDQLSPADRVRMGIAHVPEGRQVFAGMTVAENLSLGAHTQTSRAAADLRSERMRELCDQYPFLHERINDVVGNFSGGQQQMLAIARGLMSNPRLIMLDEPSLGLSPLMVQEVLNLVTQLRERGHSILLSEQNARAALAIADRGYVIENGRVTLSGKAADLLDSREIAERYLGVGAATRFSREESMRIAKSLRACIGAETKSSNPRGLQS